MEEKLGDLKGLLFIQDNLLRSSSKPKHYDLLSGITKFPVVLVNGNDKERILDAVGQKLDLTMEEMGEALSKADSKLYEIHCANLTQPFKEIVIEFAFILVEVYIGQ